MGGWNSEREVSLSSGEAVFQALIKMGYHATKIDFSRQIFQQLQEVKPDIIFNALHGQFGEDGRIQGLLDILQIPYTHSGALASAICMDKILTRKVCASIGIKSPKYSHSNTSERDRTKQVFAYSTRFLLLLLFLL